MPYLPNRLLQLLFSEKLFVVRAACNQVMDEVIAVGRQRRTQVIPRRAQGVQQVHQRSQTIQPDGVANTRRLGRITAQQNGHALLRRRNVLQARQAYSKTGHRLHSVGGRDILRHHATDRGVLSHHFLEGKRHADNAPVKLGERHAHGRV